MCGVTFFSMPQRFTRCLICNHNVTAANALPRRVRKTAPGDFGFTSFGRPSFHRGHRGSAHGNYAFLVSFSDHRNKSSVEVKLLQPQAAKFG
jgi:hypothetical protein